MEKNFDFEVYLHLTLKKLIMELKIAFLFILFSVSNALAIPTYSQVAKVSLDMKNTSLEQVLDKIESQSKFYFIFNQKQIDVNRVVDIQVENKLITDVLPELFKGTNINYVVLDKKILLTTETIDSSLLAVNSVKNQQQKQITGIVKDKNGEPLAGVNVVVTGTTQGAITDVAGNYSITVPQGGKSLTFSFIGMSSQEILIENLTQINVSLVEVEVGLEEVVVVGYGSQKVASLTGSVDVVKLPEIKEQAAATENVLKALDGRLPGVVTTYDGNPNASAVTLIRGLGSLNSSTAPLIIIDGVPTTAGLNELPTNDIESIQVLKDASASTIYGSRASNGVYIITTKTAKKGVQIEINSSFTAAFLPKDPIPLMNTEQHGKAQWMAARNDGTDPNYGVYTYQDHQDANGNWVLDKIILPDYLDAAQTMKPADTDWEKVISQTGLSNNQNITVSNGGDHGDILLSADYLNSRGTTKENAWTRSSIRVNSDYRLFHDRIKIGENIAISEMRYTGSSYLDMTPNIQSIIPVHTLDGIGWGGPVMGMSDRNNPLLVIMNNKQNHTDDVRIFGSAFADFEIIKNLHFKSTLGCDYDGFWYRNMQLEYTAGFMSQTYSTLENDANYGGSWTWNNVFNYNFNFGPNDFTFMIGQEATKAAGANLMGARDGFASEDPNYMYLDVGQSNVRNGGLAWDNAQNSYFGRVNYDYKNRYLLTAILRQDGSSRFGSNNMYALFPSISGGWAISEESFMKSIAWISNLKIRYGWGKTGNQAIANYASYTQYQAHYGDDDWPYNQGTAYDIYGADQGNLPSGYILLQLGNANLKWEACTQQDYGVDFSLFNKRLTGTFDYYLKTTTDILVEPPTLTVTGANASSWYNGATMKNWGWEGTLSYNNKIGDLGYVISANGFHNTNDMVYVLPQALGAYPGNGSTQTIIGHPLNSLYGYVVEGIFQNQAQVDAAPAQPGKGVGRLEYKDINGDGKIDADDRTWLGVNEPKLSWGLNIQLTWKGFDLSALWKSEIGRNVDMSSIKGFTDFFGFFGGQNYGTRVLDCWSPTNTTSTIPAITAADINNEHRFSSYFVENTSYMKLQSLALGYNLPESIANKIKMKKARIYAQVENLWTIKLPGNTFTGFDPQNPNILYPLPTSYTFGINLIF
jgi:TonB-linked SusC/RagA family outer membrane protein